MSEIKLNVKDTKEAREGLVISGHVYLICSNCKAYLVDLVRTRPQEEECWTVKAANCPFCDESPQTKSLGGSFKVIVQGGFHNQGFDKSTVIDNIDVNNDHVVYKLLKGENGKPVYKVK